MMTRTLTYPFMLLFFLVSSLIQHVLSSECDPTVPYISLGFVPCEFNFYAVAIKTIDTNASNFSCSWLEDSKVISTDSRDVFFWPDSCVKQTSCYTFEQVKEFKAATGEGIEGTNETNIESRIMDEFQFPDGASYVMVNCTEDAKKMAEFSAAAGKVITTSIIVIVIVILCACGGICACIWCCCRRRSRDRGAATFPPPVAPTYEPVPAAYAVQTGLSDQQPVSTATFAKTVNYGSV